MLLMILTKIEKAKNGGEKMKPMTERDEKGRITHKRRIAGTERWYDYDADGLPTHERRSDGTEYWYDYDADGHITHVRWRDGTEYWYDADGNITLNPE